MDITHWAFKNRNLIYFVIAVLTAGGALSCYRMSKLEDPEVRVKLALVATTYPGASAHEVELEVTDPLEKSIRQMPCIDNIESYSYPDLSIIQVELAATVPDSEVEQCWDLLRRRTAQAELPDGASRPQVRDDFGNVFGMFYALTGEGLTDRQLGDYAELVKREVNDLPGVERVDLYGKQEEVIHISLMQDRMSHLGVGPVEVLAALNGHTQPAYGGYYDCGDGRLRVSIDGRFHCVDDIAGMIIQGHDGGRLRLADIARIETGNRQPVRSRLLHDGEQAIGILIAADTQADIVKVGHAVDRKLEQIKAERLPVGVEMHKVFNQPERVSDALGTFALNLVESVAIVIAVLMLTMGFKSGLIIGYSLIITVLGSFCFLHMTGGTLQRVSLGALILSMGMLVDNAIVIADGILVDLKGGRPRMEAMTAIGRQTAMPLLGATLIAILAFLPIFLSPDTAGVYTRDLFIVLAVSLLLSWVLALVHVPLMANRRLHPAPDAQTGCRRTYPGKVYSLLRRCLHFGLQHRRATVIAMVMLLVLSLFGFRFMRQGFFPDMVYDQLYIEYKLPEGNNSTRTLNDLRSMEAYLKSRPEVEHVTASVGGTPGRYNLVRSIATPSLAYGELIVDFSSPQSLVDNMDEIQDYLTAHYPDAYVKLKRYNLMFKKYPIEAQFLGPDPLILHRLADTARAIMARTPEVCLITSDWEPHIPVLTVRYDQAAARALGLGRSDVSMSLLTVGGGIPIGSFHEGTHSKSIYLRCLDRNGAAVDDLSSVQVFPTLPALQGLLTEEMMVKLRAGNITKEEVAESLMGSTPLRQIAGSVDVRWEDPIIPRYNGRRSQRVQCSPVPGVETERARQAVAAQIERIPLPPGYSLEWQGEKNASTKSMKYLFQNFPMAIVLMVAILIMLFKDFRKPVIILACLPFIIVGVVAVMLLTGKTFNFVAIVGTLGLMGMLIKNGIVLMDEISLQLSQGVEPIVALVDSAQSRLRPVMMASLTTILGMIPLLTDAMFGSMAAAIMGGLLFSTLITLVFIPVLYALFFKIDRDNPRHTERT